MNSSLKLFFNIVLLGFVFMSSFTYASDNAKPNIIYILADDLGIGDLSVYNSKGKIKTPNLDRLANAGMRFTDAHTSSSVCTPTRYGILTGRYAWRTRLKWGVLSAHVNALIEPNRPTIASYLRHKGYQTAAIGKWHLGMNWATVDNLPSAKFGDNVDLTQPVQNGPRQNGFDYFFGIASSGNLPPHAYMENDQTITNNLTFLKDKAALKKAGMIQAKPGWKSADYTQNEVLTSIVDKSINWIEKVNKKPFFLYLPLNAPHGPITPKTEFVGKSQLSPFADFVLEIDHHVGRILDKVDELGLSENTMIVFTADNGVSPIANVRENQKMGHYSSGIYRGLKGMLYEGGHRVPFMVRWPAKIKANTQSDYLISTTDWYATVSDILDSNPTPKDAFDSVSFYDELKGGSRSDDARGGVVLHSDIGKFAIRQGAWKLILAANGGSRRKNPKDKLSPIDGASSVELFNIDNDPQETINLSLKHPQKVKALWQLLANYINQGYSRPLGDTPLKESSDLVWEGTHIVKKYLNIPIRH